MITEVEKLVEIAETELRKVVDLAPESFVDVEEIEPKPNSKHLLLTLGYWTKDNKPGTTDERFSMATDSQGRPVGNFLNPWRRKYKRVEVDPESGKAVSIKMYEPPLGVA